MKTRILHIAAVFTLLYPCTSYCQYSGGPGDGHASRVININVPLPVELISLSAKCNNGNVLIAWETQTEINNDFFTIEKSADAITWSYHTVVTGAGNSNSVIEYSVNDISYGDISYYRLKQTDYDGTTRVAGITAVECTGLSFSILRVYPVPATGFINFDFNVPSDGFCHYSVSDIYGNKLISGTAVAEEGQNSSLLDISDLPAGIYMLTAGLAKGEYNTVRFIKLK